MNRSNDPGDRLSDTELQQFEDQLRSLTPRAPRFVLSTAELAPSSNADSTSLEERRKPGFGGWTVNRLTVAASLLLMWSVGAGMGAAVALAWVGAFNASSQGSVVEGGETSDTAVASRQTEPTDNLDSTVSAESADDAPETSPALAPTVSPTRPTEPSFPSFAMYWSIQRESQPAAQGPLSPIHVYRAAYRQADSAASAKQLLAEVLGPVASSSASTPSRSVPTSVVEYQPTLEKNQRELLRGLLGNEANRVF